MDKNKKLASLAKLIRYYILFMSTQAGSGHPTSSLSACDLLTSLFFGGYLRFDLKNPGNPLNDRVIFSKGHASPLYYALFAAAGVLSKKDLTHYRQLTSPLEGHPTPTFKYTEAAAGSLGQGLSIGFGMALALRAQVQNYQRSNNLQLTTNNLPHVFVLLGDGDMAEGSNWETIEVAGHYKQSNLIGIIDINRFGQSDETMYGHDTQSYKRRIEPFGWDTIVIDGHDYRDIAHAFELVHRSRTKPLMIIAKTLKGKGVSFLEDKAGWHGKALAEEDFQRALKELGEVDFDLKPQIKLPAVIGRTQRSAPTRTNKSVGVDPRVDPIYKIGDQIATRKAYGEALTFVGGKDPDIVVLDADVKNSTFSEIFKAAYPDRFFEMYIAEQNMVGAAVGLARRGMKPFVSTFAAFLTRTFDQIRMAAISRANIRLCGSHAGVSIGEDGPSQMGLEDLAMFRAVSGSTVLYPSDAVSTMKLVEQMVETEGVVYMRTTRPATPVLYPPDEKFTVGGSKIHGDKRDKRKRAKAIIVAAGITLHEALKAQAKLAEDGIEVVVIDCYSIKPIDSKTIKRLGDETGAVVTVEDHWFDGGLGDAVLNVFAEDTKKPVIIKLAVSAMPRSGKPTELLSWARIDSQAIVMTIKRYLN